MKLRILNNSIRLRVSQSEVLELKGQGEVSCNIQFDASNGSLFSYILRTHDDPNFRASFKNGSIIVFVPSKELEKWASSDQISMEAKQVLEDDQFLNILIEKDFKCLTDRPGEDETDLFPNPEIDTKSC